MNLEQNLIKYADLLVRAGINLQKGEGLYMSITTDAIPVARYAVKRAYELGAKDVVVDVSDDQMNLARYLYGGEDIFDVYPEYKALYLKNLYDDNYQHLIIRAQDPTLLKNVDSSRVARFGKAAGRVMQETGVQAYRMSGRTRWTIGAVPCVGWAKTIFTEDTDEEAVQKLWEKIFYAVRVDLDGPVAAWHAHDANLHKQRDFLNAARLEKVHYQGPGTDLMVYLAEGHEWVGGSKDSTAGIPFFANMPTEEVFTTPHSHKVDGTLRATKPLNLNGTLVDGMNFVFKDGAITEFSAEKGEDVFVKQMNQDENARRLGEIALVQHDSPISNTGLVFNNTLFDENASSHFAIGQSYAYAMQGGTEASVKDLVARGANQSLVHTDFMVGAADVDVTGYSFDGTQIPLLKNGNWVI